MVKNAERAGSKNIRNKTRGVTTPTALVALLFISSLTISGAILSSGFLRPNQVASIQAKIQPGNNNVETQTNSAVNKTIYMSDSTNSQNGGAVNDARIKYYVLRIRNPEGLGSSEPETGSHQFPENSVVRVAATPEAGWSFDHWIIDNSLDYSNPISITMSSTHTLTPVFIQEKFNLNIRVTGFGTTYPLPGINTYASNTLVSVRASAYEGWKFSKWMLDGHVLTNNPIDLEIYTNMELEAIFEQIGNTTVPQTMLVVSTIGQGTVSKNPDLASYALGSSVQLKATPASGWVFKGWTGDESGSSNPLTLSMTGNKVVTATFTMIESIITATAGSGGTITPSGNVVVDYGSSQTFTITANTGYHINDVFVDGSTIGVVSSYSFNNVQTSHTISASFSNKYTIISSAGLGGSISPQGTASVTQGGSRTFNISPSAGYRVSNVLIDGVSVGAVTSYTFSNVQADHTISASFVLNTSVTYTITVSAASNGQITPPGPIVTINAGVSQVFTIMPNPGYHTLDVVVDGVSQGAVGIYTFVNVQGNHAISATFAPGEYTVSTAIVGQGTVSKNPDRATYSYGTSVQMTATPATGWIFTGWSGDLTGNVNPSVLTVDGNEAVTANFAQLQVSYVLTVQQPDGSGYNTPAAGSYTYNQGTTVQVTATPAPSWRVDHWVIDGSIIEDTDSITITMTSAHTVKVYFTLIQFTLTLSMSGLGTVTPIPPGGTYASGTIVTLTATPVAGYEFSGWSGDASGSSNSVAVTMTSDKEVTATFTQGGDPSNVKQIWKEGNTYYATGGRSSTSFSTLWNLVHSDLKAGDTVHFAANTEYIADNAIKLTRSGITLIGDLGSDGRPTAYIRAYSSKIPSTSYMFYCSADDTTLIGLGFSGLGSILEDGYYRDRVVSYTMIHFDNADNVVIDSCAMVHTQQYCLNLLSCRNLWVKNSLFQYTQNGISVSNGGSTWCTGVIEDNEIRDCSQAGVKLRLCDGVIVRNNEIHLEYTYWRSFNHLGNPGPDGRGVEESGEVHGAEGIYFGCNDAPSLNCDMYGNVITDDSVHGAVGDYFNAPRSYGCLIGEDTAGYSVKTANNYFHDNTVDGVYYPLYVQGDINRAPQPLIVYSDGNTITSYVTNVVKYAD